MFSASDILGRRAFYCSTGCESAPSIWLIESTLISGLPGGRQRRQDGFDGRLSRLYSAVNVNTLFAEPRDY
jgi:hypothetical protein